MLKDLEGLRELLSLGGKDKKKSEDIDSEVNINIRFSNSSNRNTKSKDDALSILSKEILGAKDRENQQNDRQYQSYQNGIYSIQQVAHGTIHKTPKNVYTPLDKYSDPLSNVPSVNPDLQRVLFSPGVHYASDPRTKKPNIENRIRNIPNLNQFRFDKLPKFCPPSLDPKLLEIAHQFNSSNDVKDKRLQRQQGKIKYFSSTSSMTAILGQFHKLLSHDRKIQLPQFSRFYPEKTSLSGIFKFPVSTVIVPKGGGLFAMTADRALDTEITLSWLGNLLELLLTTDQKEFNKYLLGYEEEPETKPNAFHYAKMGGFLMRSQLDARHPDLPGTGVFDLKTRAVTSIRFDVDHTEFNPTFYNIIRTRGTFESFERELFETIKIVMFKFGMQARIGNMDGIFIAFHNIKNLLGFQYLPLSEIDNIFFGASLDEQPTYITDRKVSGREIIKNIGSHWQDKREVLSSYMANHEFEASMEIWEKLLNTVEKDTKGKPYKLTLKYCTQTERWESWKTID
ncbi:unnamed protein product [Ambrosiozyma monospora]|uniref:Unnamed protein product n=1 Tax=Ambrosiozyma monospora TaxID=43982 RepID=A0ACB5SRV4_AMBMO|nr:unnamed protein product [Ambrosiozyma monospora]